MTTEHTSAEPPRVPETFAWTARPWGVTLTCRPMEPLAFHGWSTKQLRLLGPESACAAQWSRLAATAGVEADGLRLLTQVHGADVVSAGQSDRGDRPSADGVVSGDPRVLLSVRVADCVPVLLVDRRTGAAAAVHAGWRGTSAGIVRAAVERLSEVLGSRPRDLVAGLGPSIGPCCYEVGSELVQAFRDGGHDEGRIAAWFAPGHSLHLDLWSANRDQLVAAGVPATAVHVAGLCTACHEAWFYSYRREGCAAGRLAGFIRPGGAGRTGT